MLSDQKTLLLDFFDVKFFQTSIILLIIFLAYKFFKSNILLKLEKAWQNHIQNIFLSFFSGICFAFGLEPFNNFIAVFLAFFVIYNLYLNDKSLKEILICSTSFCVSYVFLSLRWIYFAPLNFDGFEIFAPLALLVFIIYFSLYFFFFSLSFSFMSRVFLRKSNIEKISFFVGPIVFSFLFIFIFEFLRSIGKFGFPWNLISTIFLDFEFAQNLIHKFGIFICGFFIILIFAIIFNIINALYKKNFSDFIKSFIFLFLLIFLYFLVNQKDYKDQCTFKKNSDFLNKPYIGIRIISTNISQKHKWKKELFKANIINNAKLSFEKNSDEIKYFIWPEASFPFALEIDKRKNFENQIQDDPVISYLASFLKKNQFLIFGVILKERLSSNDYIFFNSIIGIDHEGKIHSLYKKRRLVPFGEFIPFIDKIAYFNKNLYLKLRNFNLIKPGDDHESQDYFKFSDHSGKIFFPLICFEAIFPFSKNHKKIFQEVDMILNLSNDAWFDSEIAPRQFLRMTRVRSIESSKSSIRVTNRGFSCLIDQNGKIISKLEEKADNSSFIDVYIK